MHSKLPQNSLNSDLKSPRSDLGFWNLLLSAAVLLLVSRFRLLVFGVSVSLVSLKLMVDLTPPFLRPTLLLLLHHTLLGSMCLALL